MKHKASTLLELIFVIVIVSFLSTATFKGMQAITIRAYKAKEITKLSLESQIAVNQISNYLSYRVPYTVIGYNGTDDFKPIGDITSGGYTILEWFGRANEAFVDGNYSGFADMDTLLSSKFASQGSDGNALDATTNAKFGTSDINLIFSGSFDRATSDTNDYNSSFGWHRKASNDSFDIDMSSDGNITVTDSVKPKHIYEKYFIVDSAYAIARGANINLKASCIKDLNTTGDINDNTLFLFSNYRPWKGETFCADKSGSQEGNASILMQDIDSFNFQEMDYTIRIHLDINKTIRGSSPIHFSKMKVVF